MEGNDALMYGLIPDKQGISFGEVIDKRLYNFVVNRKTCYKSVNVNRVS
jgi:hypothetical protein